MYVSTDILVSVLSQSSDMVPGDVLVNCIPLDYIVNERGFLYFVIW